MNLFTNTKKLPVALSAGSFFCMLILVLFTNPLNSVVYAMLFFLATCVLLISLGYLLASLHSSNLDSKKRFRIYVISIFITVMLMFRSAGALGWVDAVVLVLITLGLLFYGSRRA